MKTAYQYLRISQEDQSNFSITGQQRFNENFAKRIDCKILKTFIDDGRSAKDFNRPEWRKLEKEIYRNRKQIDYLIISKYDRLIRNVREGLVFLEKIESRWGIRVISAMEDYFSHPDDPMFVRDRTQRLLDAEVERLRISDRVKMAHWQARSEGRYIFTAPFGYINKRDHLNKPIIVPHEKRARIVRFIFKKFIEGIAMITIRKEATRMGFYIKGNSAIQRVLSNPVYAGFVEVKAYRDEKHKMVRGIHEPIISEQTYYVAQNVLKAQEYGKKTVIREDMPLRGVIACPHCRTIYTGGRSKGRNRYYTYYRCNECRKMNISAKKVDRMVLRIFDQLEIPEKHLKYIKLKSKSHIENIQSGYKTRKAEAKKSILKLDRKIESLEEKFINDLIGVEVYKKFKGKYEREKHNLRTNLEESKPIASVDQHIEDLFPIVKDLSGFYTLLSTAGKQIFFTGLFGRGSTVSREVIEPVFIHPIFRYNGLTIKELRLKESPDILNNIEATPVRVTEGTEIETVTDFIKLINRSLYA